ncbi:hypothetical protein BCR34DRAFT_568360 [Clohesyomyces aquaticus]|uniref:Uncharacterized protein n=1 Tax=Clohesyomyces aquaticus TaxID=1231657 RepID=A0A1Y1ZGM6_9PLEO|nr:hypothetical protein BCR34DRAFT_568360 [Clohesyomyces aquaticus]
MLCFASHHFIKRRNIPLSLPSPTAVREVANPPTDPGARLATGPHLSFPNIGLLVKKCGIWVTLAEANTYCSSATLFLKLCLVQKCMSGARMTGRFSFIRSQ